MIFNVVFTDPEKSIKFSCGRSSLWKAQDAAMDWPDNPAKAGRLSYAWGYFAAKSAGKLEDLGIVDPAMSLDDAVNFLADMWDLEITEQTEQTAPLADGQSR